MRPISTTPGLHGACWRDQPPPLPRLPSSHVKVPKRLLGNASHGVMLLKDPCLAPCPATQSNASFCAQGRERSCPPLPGPGWPGQSASFPLAGRGGWVGACQGSSCRPLIAKDNEPGICMGTRLGRVPAHGGTCHCMHVPGSCHTTCLRACPICPCLHQAPGEPPGSSPSGRLGPIHPAPHSVTQFTLPLLLASRAELMGARAVTGLDRVELPQSLV